MSKDYFSTQSAAYKTYRPTYPASLFKYLVRDLAPGAVVWDCATGSGQAVTGLSGYPIEVIASDQSARQMVHAPRIGNVHYVQAPAETMPLRSHAVDLVIVAQALHWFDFDSFYLEINRVLKPGGRIAAWTYSFLAVAPQLGADIDAVLRWFYQDIVGPYWPPERRWIDDAYASIPFPFEEISPPEFIIDVAWNLPAILGYVSSWSAVQRYRQARANDPMSLLANRLTPLWGDETVARSLRWSLGLRIGLLNS